MSNSNSITILDNLTAGDIQRHPCTWGMWNRVIPFSAYDALMEAYPAMYQVIGSRPVAQNARYDLDAALLLKQTDIDPRMKEFIAAHVSQEFWLKIVKLLGKRIRKEHPYLEDRVGKSLEDFTVGVRNAKRKEDEERPDVEMDAKPGYNTPPIKVSSVRGHHVDNPRELFAAIMYCREPKDDSNGGDFIVAKSKYTPDKWKWHGKAELYPDHFEDFAEVPYSQNAACFFINSIHAVHHVTPRDVTPYPRRLMNFIAEVRQPLFAIPKKRFRTPNDSNENSTEDVLGRKLQTSP